MKTLGSRLAALRREKELSQAELARMLNTGQSTIAMYERDKRIPNPEMLDRLANFFGVSVDYLLARTDRRVEAQSAGNSSISQHRDQPAPCEPGVAYAAADPRFAELLRRLPELTREEKESLAEYWAMALKVIEKERRRRNQPPNGKE